VVIGLFGNKKKKSPFFYLIFVIMSGLGAGFQPEGVPRRFTDWIV
jgi:hypothetical protein